MTGGVILDNLIVFMMWIGVCSEKFLNDRLQDMHVRKVSIKWLS